MTQLSQETQLTIAASSRLPGYKFSPNDAELISYYLRKKMDGEESCVEVITEVDICNYEPWELPAKSVMHSNSEWFFFSARGRKYPKGSQSRRATDRGYWKATGKERNVMSADSVVLGTKRTLVFHIGRAPKGQRTKWIMHEYCMSAKPPDSMVVCRIKCNNEFRLNRKTSKQGSLTQQQPSTSKNSNFSTTDGDNDHDATNLVEPFFQISNYNSYFPEHIESQCESEPKVSSGDGGSLDLPQDPGGGEEEQYLEMLNKEEWYHMLFNNDIVNPEEALLSTNLEFERNYEEFPTHVQGTANRRLKLKTSNLKISDPEESKSKGNSKDSPKCFLTLLSGVNWRHFFVVFLVSSLLIFVASFMGWFKSVKD